MNLLDEIVLTLETLSTENPDLEFFFYLEEDGSSRILGKDLFSDIRFSAVFKTTDEAIERIRFQLEEIENDKEKD